MSGASELSRKILEPRGLALNGALVLVYFLAGRLGLQFAEAHPVVAPVWPASGLALAALLLLGPRVWPGLFLGAFFLNLAASGQVLPSLGIGTGNTLEGLCGAYLINRYTARDGGLERLRGVCVFVGFGALLATAIAATVGVTSLVLTGAASVGSAGALWVTWWLGDAVGVLIVTPVIVLWARSPRLNWSREQFIEVGLIFGLIVLVGLTIFWGWIPARLETYPLNFLCIPILVWMALRFTQREAATAVLILAGTAIMGSVAGSGPFGAPLQDASLLPLQMFLGLAAAMTLLFGAIASENRRGHEASLRVATLVNSSNDAIITKSLDGTITSWNPAAERLFGYAPEEVVGRNIALLIPAEHQHQEERILASIRRGEVVNHFETARIRKDGTTIHVSLTVSPLKSPDGRVIGASKIGRDISDRVRLEGELQLLLARERAAREEAESANRAKDEFLAILSHELRTPLNAVYGWARIMQAGELDDETEERALDAIVRNANAQVQMIDDLLDVARVTNDKMRLEVQPVDVREVIEAALDAVGPTAETKGVDLEPALDGHGVMVNGDPGRLQQIVSNLVMNAVKFTPSGGRVQVDLRQVDHRVEIEVSDNGQGIPTHVLPFVFDRFRQWDSSSTRAHRGLGLGLALVKHLTELHHGTVSAESAGEGKGSKFTVSLPLRPAAPSVDAPAKVPALGIGFRLAGLKVLAVDDDPDALELTSRILSRAGADVKACRSAPEALATFQDWRPDVLVSDIEMPGENGYSLIRKVRALGVGRGARTPAVALTAYGRMADRSQALSAGFTMHVPKPLDPEEFTTIIASVARVLRSKDGAN